MDIPALQAFVAVAETRSFSRAAERCFLTQPAMSKRIATLEAELGTALFDRISRQVQLTQAGTALLARARAILIELEDAKRAITNLSGDVTGPLHMAASHHIGLHRLPLALKRFHKVYPEVELALRFLDSEAACTAVEQGSLELALVTLPDQGSSRLALTKIWDDPLEIVVGRGHPLAREKAASPITLLNYPAILPGPGTFTREIILSALPTIREGIRIGMSTNYLEVLKMLAAVGFGWSTLPQTLIDETLEVVHIKSIRIKRELGIVIHRSRTLSNAARAMIEVIREQV